MALTATAGREDELDSIRAFIDDLPRGPQAVSISGPAGIGKTVLLESGVELARERGRVLVSRGIPAVGGVLWAGRARAELARISGRSQRSSPTRSDRSRRWPRGSEQQGDAASLHMGVSTVESHLSSVYRKLNIKRAQLAAALAERQ